MKNKVQELYALEQLSGGNTFVHKIHPMVKLLATAVFIVVVVSFDRYAFGRLIPYVFFPTLLMAFSETPYSMLIKRFLIALPFGLFAGITNVIYDRASAFAVGCVTVSFGVVSLFTILFRTYLCVMAVLVLVSVTPFTEITNSMRRLRVPSLFVINFEMIYRYIGVLFEEAYSMYIAYSLRSTNKKGIEIKDMGSFVGQLLLRSFDRADRVYNAMKCRGYALKSIVRNDKKLTRGDWVFFAVICLFCITFRFIDANTILAGILGGLG